MIKFNTGSNFAEGVAVLSPLILEFINQTEAQVGLEDQAAKLGFVIETPATPEGKITAKIGASPAQTIGEDEEFPLISQEQGYEKSYKLNTSGARHKVTKTFAKWVENGAQHLAGADSSVVSSINEFKDGLMDLTDAIMMKLNVDMTKVLANGFVATEAFGAGSPSPDGVALFSASHVVKKTGATYSNVINALLTATSLEAAIEAYKTNIKMGNGFRVKTPDIFDLLVPRALETTARKILNSSGDQAGIYAGTGSNANLLNVFSFQGSKVRLVVLDLLGEPDENGVVIGGSDAGTKWFLYNRELAQKLKAFRIFKLWDKEVDVYTKPETGSTFVQIGSHYGVEHYNPEVIMGFDGTVN